MSDTGNIHVEVAYALPERQWLIALCLPAGACAADALAASGLADLFPRWRRHCPPLGIWGRPVSTQQVLTDGDRVEIYRPLTVDPKAARRRRAGK